MSHSVSESGSECDESMRTAAVIIIPDHSRFKLDNDRRHTCLSLSTTHQFQNSLKHNISNDLGVVSVPFLLTLLFSYVLRRRVLVLQIHCVINSGYLLNRSLDDNRLSSLHTDVFSKIGRLTKLYVSWLGVQSLFLLHVHVHDNVGLFFFALPPFFLLIHLSGPIFHSSILCDFFTVYNVCGVRMPPVRKLGASQDFFICGLRALVSLVWHVEYEQMPSIDLFPSPGTRRQ